MITNRLTILLAVLAMMGFSRLLNHDWSSAASGAHDLVKKTSVPEKSKRGPISYDY